MSTSATTASVQQSMHNPANAGLGRSLVAEPSDFDGSEGKYEKWKRQVKLYVLANERHFPTDNSKLIAATSYTQPEKSDISV
jgi:hypothetical protein